MFNMQDELFEKIKYTIDFVHPSDLYDEEDNAELYEDEHWNELVEYLQADKVAWGASKVVFWFQQIKNYVIKIPLMGCYEGYEEEYVKFTNAKIHSNSPYADWDYCGAEAEVYAIIEKKYPDLAKFFAATYFIGINKHDVPIYASRKVTEKTIWDMQEECKISGISRSKAAEFIETFGSCGGLTEKVISLFYEQYDEKDVDKLLSFILTYKIDDLHTGNIGIAENGKIVIMDYSGFDS